MRNSPEKQTYFKIKRKFGKQQGKSFPQYIQHEINFLPNFHLNIIFPFFIFNTHWYPFLLQKWLYGIGKIFPNSDHLTNLTFSIIIVRVGKIPGSVYYFTILILTKIRLCHIHLGSTRGIV